MGIYDFMDKHVLLTAFLALLISGAVNGVTFRPFNRWMRHRNIKAHGWPPAHCNADGDPIKKN